MVASWIALGVTEADAKILSNPGNKPSLVISLKGNTVIWKEVYPGAPAYSTTYSVELGEKKTFEKPFAMSVVLIKKTGRSTRMEITMGGKQFCTEATFSAEGMDMKGDFDGVEWSTFMSRQAPEVGRCLLLMS